MTNSKRQRLKQQRAENKKRRLSDKQIKFLSESLETLRWRSSTLTKTKRNGHTRNYETLCWDYYRQRKSEAEELGLGEEFRSMCWEAAGRFCDPRGLRSGQRYYKFGPPTVAEEAAAV